MKYINLVFCLILSLSVAGQSAMEDYLAHHHYSFTLEEGFSPALSDTLQRRMTGYKLILQAEGGSHDLSIYFHLELMWLKFLQQRFGITHFIGESGPASEVLFNKYLDTGDSTMHFRSPFWKNLYQYDSTLPPAQRLHYIGVDFDYPGYYFRALKILLPDNDEPASIHDAIQKIREVPDTMRDCDFTVRFNDQLRKTFTSHRDEFAGSLKDRFPEFEHIIMNESTCHDVRKNRNAKMAARFFENHRRIGDSLYFGEFGMAHTVLNTNDLASIIQRTEPFTGQVCVINLYCSDCSVAREEISNWPLKSMEKDIQQYFLPLCRSGFTLFDLTQGGELTSAYSKLGQWLIIAKDQH